MPGSIVQAASRAAIILAAMLLLAALAWFTLKKTGIAKSGVRFNPRDIRTWPLRFVLIDAAIYALAFSIMMTWMGEIVQAGAYAAIILPVMLLLMVGSASRFNPRDMRNWLHGAILVHAAIYTLIFSIMMTWMDGSTYANVLAAVISGDLAWDAVPRLAARFLK